jgi:hypothetical protein
VNKNGLKALLNDGNPVAQNKAQNKVEMKNELEASVAQNAGSPMVK